MLFTLALHIFVRPPVPLLHLRERRLLLFVQAQVDPADQVADKQLRRQQDQDGYFAGQVVRRVLRQERLRANDVRQAERGERHGVHCDLLRVAARVACVVGVDNGERTSVNADQVRCCRSRSDKPRTVVRRETNVQNRRAPFFPESFSPTSMAAPTMVGMIERTIGVMRAFWMNSESIAHEASRQGRHMLTFLSEYHPKNKVDSAPMRPPGVPRIRTCLDLKDRFKIHRFARN